MQSVRIMMTVPLIHSEELEHNFECKLTLLDDTNFSAIAKPIKSETFSAIAKPSENFSAIAEPGRNNISSANRERRQDTCMIEIDLDYLPENRVTCCENLRQHCANFKLRVSNAVHSAYSNARSCFSSFFYACCDFAFILFD
jgi:hypothetical protein